MFFHSFSESILGCFSQQHVKKKFVPKPYHFEVASAEECQCKCQERDECKYFELQNDVDCYLKNENAASVAKPNKYFIFGPKYCEGKGMRIHILLII